MTQQQWTAVDRYLTEMLLAPDPVLDSVLRASDEAGLPAINVSPMQGKFLMILAQTLQATAILEIGTLGGYSTIWLARGMAAGGQLLTLEANPEHAKVARRNIANAGFTCSINVREGKALELLPDVTKDYDRPFDLIFIDADKPNNPNYFSWALRLSRPGSLIVIDNVVRDGAVINAKSADPNIQGIRKLNALLAAESRVVATTIQTVGSKGYDGFSIARVVR
jgi:predicted O-methyltransferase YrrM